MRDLIIVISDFYVPVSATTASPADEHALVGLSNVIRFGTSSVLSGGWRAWLAQWFERADLASAAPATIAAMAVESSAQRATAIRGEVATNSQATTSNAISARAGDLSTTGGAAATASDDARPLMTWLADPVHLMAGMRNVHMDFTGLLRLDAQAQSQLVSSFEAAFEHSSYKLAALPTGGFVLTGPPASALLERDPARCLGSTIESAVPSGREAAPLQRLAGEMEMWLYAHPINAARARERQRPITTLWFWGGGPTLEASTTSVQRRLSQNASTTHAGATLDSQSSERAADSSRSGAPLAHAIYSGDAYAAGLARAMGMENRAIPADLNEVLGQREERTVVVVEAFHLPEGSAVATPLQALEAVDRRWIAPAFDALGQGSIERLTLVANDRVISVRSRDRMKLWRRKRGALSGWK